MNCILDTIFNTRFCYFNNEISSKQIHSTGQHTVVFHNWMYQLFWTTQLNKWFHDFPPLSLLAVLVLVSDLKVSFNFSIIFLYSKFKFFKHLWKWKWHDIRPSMVTHTRNLCSAFNPSKVHTHSSEHTHGAVGSHLCCGARGAVGGSVPCSRAPQSWYWGWRESAVRLRLRLFLFVTYTIT